jgi:hypothetical protein|tara:strand:+ start:3048 stop:3167 length:120 start_codon:yes stop_codon:yes gene_type:complete
MIDKKTIYIITGTTILAGAIIYLSIKDVFNFKKRSEEKD